MDAPPDKEDLRHLPARERACWKPAACMCRMCSPRIPAQGFALLEDLGNTHMLTALNRGADAALLYDEALDELARLQLHGDARLAAVATL